MNRLTWIKNMPLKGSNMRIQTLDLISINDKIKLYINLSSNEEIPGVLRHTLNYDLTPNNLNYDDILKSLFDIIFNKCGDKLWTIDYGDNITKPCSFNHIVKRYKFNNIELVDALNNISLNFRNLNFDLKKLNDFLLNIKSNRYQINYS